MTSPKSFTFLHAADLHLDSPLRGLDRYEGAPADLLRGATRRAFVNLIDYALEEEVAFLILAGDIFDGDWRDYGTGLFFSQQMSRLHAAAIPVYLIRGNHDALNRVTRTLRLPPNVHTFSGKAPETFCLEDLQVALHGQSFSSRAEEKNLAAKYPEPLQGWTNIGVLHTSLDGREGHDVYAPCGLGDLTAKDYDYWALGHIHQREWVHQDPWVVFPGNLQGRHIREQGERGLMRVKVDEGGIQGVEFVPLDVLRWTACSVNLGGYETEDSLFRALTESFHGLLESAEDRFLAVRLTLEGSSPLHWTLQKDRERWIHECRQLAFEVGQDQIWLEKVRFRTTPPGPLEGVWEGPLQEVAEVVEELRQSPELQEEILSPLNKLQTRTARAYREDPQQAPWENPERLLQEAADLVLAQLMEEDHEA